MCLQSNYKIWIQFCLVTLLSFIIMPFVSGQDLKKEIYVVSSYKPRIADAEKIASMPSILDTAKIKTETEYNLLPSRIKTDYTLRPIKAAKMVGTPLDKLYKSYLKLGLGNYVTPLAEFSIHNLRSKDYAVGAYIFHKSSYNKLELTNGAKVPAGYGRNEVSVYGKKFYDNINLTADLGLNTHRVRQYGYNVDNFPDSIPEPETEDIKQSFFHIYGAAGVYSVNPDSGAFNFSVNLLGEYYQDHFKNKEPHFNIRGMVSYPIKSFRFGLDASYDYFTFSYQPEKESIVMLRPFALKRKAEWELKLAARLFFENRDGSRGYIFPDASFRFRIVEEALVMNIAVTGSIENNSYLSVTTENPFLIPGINPRNTIHFFKALGGIEGQLNRNMAYRLNVTFDALEDALFFINDTSTLLQNQFGVVYDNTDLIQYHGEFSWDPLTYLSFFLKANYYNYKMTAEDHPWHKPATDITFAAIYNFKEKIFLEFDYLFLGKRYAQNYNDPGDPFLLKPVHDLNLKLEYKYSNILSGFIHVYNLLSQKYYLWNFYPNQRLNVLIGVTYKF